MTNIINPFYIKKNKHQSVGKQNLKIHPQIIMEQSIRRTIEEQTLLYKAQRRNNIIIEIFYEHNNFMGIFKVHLVLYSNRINDKKHSK